MKIGTANPNGEGDYALLDIYPYEPVFVNLSKPLEEQIPEGPALTAARALLQEKK